jgi:hypothetical protein
MAGLGAPTPDLFLLLLCAMVVGLLAFATWTDGYIRGMRYARQASAEMRAERDT